jgi:hypothetical protein
MSVVVVLRRNRGPRRIDMAWAMVIGGVGITAAAQDAHAQLLDRYLPANVPGYQDWIASASAAQTDLGYAPLGVRLGNIILQPSVTESFGYETAPFGAVNGGTAIEQTDAALTMNSDWTHNSVNGALNVTNVQFLKPGLSFTNWTAGAGGTLQIVGNTLELGYAHITAVELPTDFGAFAQTAPVQDQDDDFRARYTIGSGRISLEPAVEADIYRFGSYTGPGVAATQGLFDRNSLTASITGNYELSGGHNLLLIVSDSIAQFAGSSPLRPANYNDISVLFGLEYRASAILSYRALVGYEERNATSQGTFDSTLAAPAAELDVIWNPTSLTTITGKISQSFQDLPTNEGQGLTEASVVLLFDHSWSRALEFQGSARFIRASFQQGGGAEYGVETTLEADYHLSRHVVISAEYDFAEASGQNSTSLSYRNHAIFLRGRLQW